MAVVSVLAFSSVKVLEEVALELGGGNFVVIVVGAGGASGFGVGVCGFESGCSGTGGVADGVGFDPPMLSEIVCGGPRLSSDGNGGWAGCGTGSGGGWAGALKDLPGTNSNAPALSLLMAIWWDEGEDCAQRTG